MIFPRMKIVDKKESKIVISNSSYLDKIYSILWNIIGKSRDWLGLFILIYSKWKILITVKKTQKRCYAIVNRKVKIVFIRLRTKFDSLSKSGGYIDSKNYSNLIWHFLSCIQNRKKWFLFFSSLQHKIVFTGFCKYYLF